MQTELCPTECMALKCANVCNHDEIVSGCTEKERLGAKAIISILYY